MFKTTPFENVNLTKLKKLLKDANGGYFPVGSNSF